MKININLKKSYIKIFAVATILAVSFQNCAKQGFSQNSAINGESDSLKNGLVKTDSISNGVLIETTSANNADTQVRSIASSDSSESNRANSTTTTTNSSVRNPSQISFSNPAAASSSGSAPKQSASAVNQNVSASNQNASVTASGCNRQGLSTSINWYNLPLNKKCSADLTSMAEGEEKTYGTATDHITVKCVNSKYVYDDIISVSDLAQTPDSKTTTCGGGLNTNPYLRAQVWYKGQCYAKQPYPDSGLSECSNDIEKLEVTVCSEVQINLWDANLGSQKVSSFIYKINGNQVESQTASRLSPSNANFNTVGSYTYLIEASQNERKATESISIKVVNVPGWDQRINPNTGFGEQVICDNENNQILHGCKLLANGLCEN